MDKSKNPVDRKSKTKGAQKEVENVLDPTIMSIKGHLRKEQLTAKRRRLCGSYHGEDHNRKTCLNKNSTPNKHKGASCCSSHTNGVGLDMDLNLSLVINPTMMLIA